MIRWEGHATTGRHGGEGGGAVEGRKALVARIVPLGVEAISRRPVVGLLRCKVSGDEVWLRTFAALILRRSGSKCS